MFVVATSEDSARSWAEDGIGLILKKEQAQERASLLNRYPGLIDHQLVFEVELEIEVHSVAEVLP